MPIRDPAARNASLDNDYGATHGPNAPDDFEVALFLGDPLLGGIEVPDETEVDDGSGGTVLVPNGYARGTVANDASWAPAADEMKSTAAPVQLPDVLAEYPDTVTHWALFDAADSTTMWDFGRLAAPLDVRSAGPGPAVTPTVFYADSITEE